MTNDCCMTFFQRVARVFQTLHHEAVICRPEYSYSDCCSCLGQFTISQVRFVLYCIVFIHFYSAFHGMNLSRPQQLTLCWRLQDEALPATASEGLAQVSYVAATTVFKPATLRSKGINSTNAPPRPTR